MSLLWGEPGINEKQKTQEQQQKENSRFPTWFLQIISHTDAWVTRVSKQWSRVYVFCLGKAIHFKAVSVL